MTSLLIIDDDRYIRALIKAVFPHFAVREADDVEGGICAFLAEEPDVVLLDMNLNGNSGLRVLEGIRNTNPSVPIIIVTSDMSQALSVRCFRLGATDFVSKPFDPDYLELVVTRALRAIESERLMREAESSLLVERHSNEFSRMMLSYFNHELRTPIHHALSFLGVLGEELVTVQSEQVHKWYEKSVMAVKATMALVEHFMQISAVETGESIEDNDTVRDILTSLLGVFEGKIALSIESGADFSCKSSLRLAFKELLYNAIQSTQKIMVTVREVASGVEIKIVSESVFREIDPYWMLIMRKLLSASGGELRSSDRSFTVQLR